MTGTTARKSHLAITLPTLENARDGHQRKQADAATTFLECQVTLWAARGQLAGLDQYLADPHGNGTPKRGRYADAVRAAAVILRSAPPPAVPAIPSPAHEGPVKDEAILPEERVWREHDTARLPVADAPPAADFVISFSKARQVAPLPALTPKEEALATDVFGPEQASEPGLQLSPVLRMEGPITGAELARVREDGTRERDTTDTPGGSELRAHNSPGGQTPGPGAPAPKQDDPALDVLDDMLIEGEK